MISHASRSSRHSKGSDPRSSPHKSAVYHKPSRLPAPPPGEEWEVDGEEAMASPLYSVMPHSTKKFDENVLASPYAPTVGKYPNELRTNLKSERYLSIKELPVTSHSLTQTFLNKSRAGVSPAPGKTLAQKVLRPVGRTGPLATERKAFRPKVIRSSDKATIWDVMGNAGSLKTVLACCQVREVVSLLKVNHRLRKLREIQKRFIELFVGGLDFPIRLKYWASVIDKCRKGTSAEQFFRSASRCPREIRDDIVRTPSFIPRQSLTQKQQHTLMRVLDAVCNCNRDVGYCQGMNYIGGFLIQLLPCEEDSFWILQALLNDYKVKNLFKPGLAQLKMLCFQLDCLMQHYLPQVRQRLKESGISTEIYSAKWFLTLMTYELPSQMLMKVWDLFFLKGWKIFFKVILALLTTFKESILLCDFASIPHLLKGIPKKVKSEESLLKLALRIKVTKRLLKDLETMKSRNLKGRFQLLLGKERKLEWVVTPKLTEVGEDSSLASRLLSKVKQLFGGENKDWEEETTTGLDSTICLEELPSQSELRNPADISQLSHEELKEALSIKDLDSGKVYYQDVSTPKAAQFCREKTKKPRLPPAFHLLPKVEESQFAPE